MMSSGSVLRIKTDTLVRRLFLLVAGWQMRRNPGETMFWFFMSPFMVAGAYSVMRLGIPDLLRKSPRTIEELAELSGCRKDNLYRVLRALTSIGLLEPAPGKRYKLTKTGELTCEKDTNSLYYLALSMNQTYMPVFRHLHRTLQTGESPMKMEHGMPMWDYYAMNPEEGVLFDKWMAGFTSHHAGSILDVLDFSRFATIVDVGGGRGALLAAILKACPSSRGILYDRESVVHGAEAVFEEAGVGNRCRAIAGDFRKEVPPGADAYIVKHVFHDWGDKEVKEVLTGIRTAIGKDRSARLFIVEGLVEHSVSKGETLRQWCDIAQMVWTPGRERTLEEYRKLLGETGFQIECLVPTRVGDVVILEARVSE